MCLYILAYFLKATVIKDKYSIQNIIDNAMCTS